MFLKQEKDNTCVESTHICCKDFLKNDDTIAKGLEIVIKNLKPVDKPTDVSENEGKLFSFTCVISKESNNSFKLLLFLVSNAIHETNSVSTFGEEEARENTFFNDNQANDIDPHSLHSAFNKPRSDALEVNRKAQILLKATSKIRNNSSDLDGKNLSEVEAKQ